MVFVGPASREDKGFKHSYDVVVDSYQSEEDLSDPDFYKMAGRVGNCNTMLFIDAYTYLDGSPYAVHRYARS